MPARSKSQFRFLEALAHGGIKKKSFSKEQAQEFIDSTPSYKSLPEKKNKLSRLHKIIKRN